MIGQYRKSLIQHQPGIATIKNDASIICITMVKSAIGWFEIVEVLMFDLYEVISSNDEYIDN